MKRCSLPMLSLAMLTALPAQAANEQAAGRPARAPFVFEAGRMELRQLVHRCGTYLRRNIVLDDAELLPQGVHGGRPPRGAAPAAADAPEPMSVELLQPVVTDEAGCEELLTGLLWTRGFALVPIDEAKGVYEVLAMNGPRAREIASRAVMRTVEQVLARPASKQFVTVVFHLQHVHASTAVNSLRPFFGHQPQPTTLTIGNAGHPTAVLLSGPQDQAASAVRLLQAVDQPTPPESPVLQQQSLQQLHRQLDELRKRLAALEEKDGAR